MKNVKQVVDKYSDLISKAERYIWVNPEVGYKEFKTNEYMITEFEKLGYQVQRFEGITGFTAYYDTGKKGATVLLLAELDAIYCKMHPESDNQTGACHVCGHNIQCATLLGVAAAVRETSINGELSGKIKFGIVPAEEGVEISYRAQLIEDGVIKFTSGKPECISRGLLSDVDVAMMVHAKNLEDTGVLYYVGRGANGVIRKKTIITGKSAHAGGFPENGINALYAEELVFSATNALRETFRDEDHVRFHSIVTKGGDSVNTIPEEVIIESYVRAGNSKTMSEVNAKINRAIVGACLAMGAKVKIVDLAGSEPLVDNRELAKIVNEVGTALVGEGKSVVTDDWSRGSTDMGDVSSLVPSVHFYCDTHRGNIHGKDYYVENPLKACLDSAYLQVASVMELLKNNSEKAYLVKGKYKPVYATLEEYLKAKTDINKTHDCIEYDGDKVKINL